MCLLRHSDYSDGYSYCICVVVEVLRWLLGCCYVVVKESSIVGAFEWLLGCCYVQVQVTHR